MADGQPHLVVNPADDDDFGDAVQAALDTAQTPEALGALLRSAYPDVLVRPRSLAGEPDVVWYVYRDGHWVHRDGP